MVHHKTLKRYETAPVNSLSVEELNLAVSTLSPIADEQAQALNKTKARIKELEKRLEDVAREEEEREEREAFERLRQEAQARGKSISELVAILDKQQEAGATGSVAPHFRG